MTFLIAEVKEEFITQTVLTASEQTQVKAAQQTPNQQISNQQIPNQQSQNQTDTRHNAKQVTSPASCDSRSPRDSLELKRSPVMVSSTSTTSDMSDALEVRKRSQSSRSSPYVTASGDEAGSRSPMSRPTSGELDVSLLGRSAPGSSEYETCQSSFKSSTTFVSASQDTSYATARSSLSSRSHSSRESTLSVDSESSGHLGEISSDVSETIVSDRESSLTPNQMLLEDQDDDTQTNTLPQTVIQAHFSNVRPDQNVQQVCEDLPPMHPQVLQLHQESGPHSISESSATWNSSSLGTAVPAPHATSQPDLPSTVDVSKGAHCEVGRTYSNRSLETMSDVASDVATGSGNSASALISQSSNASSVLSERARAQLSYDLSPDSTPSGLGVGAAEATSVSPYRPGSPVPPEDDVHFGAKSVLSNVQDRSPCSDDNDVCMGYAFGIDRDIEPPSDLYTHHEVDEDEDSNPLPPNTTELRPASMESDYMHSKPISSAFARLTESGGASATGSNASSLQEFEKVTAVLVASRLLNCETLTAGS